MYVCECIFVPNSSSLSAICTAVYSCKRRTCMPYVLSSVWYKASRKENEGMVGVSGESKPTRRNTLPGGMLEFVCISECFVCKSRSLIYLHECVGGKGAAEKHLELYENPGISTSGNRIAAYQTHTCLYAHHLAFTYRQSYWLPPKHLVRHSRSQFNTWQPLSVYRELKD